MRGAIVRKYMCESERQTERLKLAQQRSHRPVYVPESMFEWRNWFDNGTINW